MSDGNEADAVVSLEAGVLDSSAVVARRDEVVSAVTAHAGEIARELALLEGGDYGRSSFSTGAGEWTLKYEGGALEYLRFEGSGGAETYVVSTKRPPDPEELAAALRDYGAFVESYNEYVRGLRGVLDDVAPDYPAVASTSAVVRERDRVLGAVREAADAIADQLARHEGGNYGTYTRRVDGTRWELKWEDGRATYLRVGGTGGTYLLSQYEAPAARDVRTLAPSFEGFVSAYNEYVADLESDLASISFGE